jgi:hypothetical protein
MANQTPYIGGMHLDLTEEESAALLNELDRLIDGDKLPLSSVYRC